MENENRLISAAAAKRIMDDCVLWETDEVEIAKTCIDLTPTVDAVEVVRCKDCKKWLKVEQSGTNCRYCAVSSRSRLPYDFCSYGERKQ